MGEEVHLKWQQVPNFELIAVVGEGLISSCDKSVIGANAIIDKIFWWLEDSVTEESIFMCVSILTWSGEDPFEGRVEEWQHEPLAQLLHLLPATPQLFVRCQFDAC